MQYHICYFDLLSFTNFFVEEKFSWLASKNKVADEKTEHCNLTKNLFMPLKMQIFISHFDFRRHNLWKHKLQSYRNNNSELISLHCIYQLDRDGIFCKSSRSSYAQPHALPSIFVDDQIKFANWQLLASDHESYC